MNKLNLTDIDDEGRKAAYKYYNQWWREVMERIQIKLLKEIILKDIELKE